jgi:hypothetical protein
MTIGSFTLDAVDWRLVPLLRDRGREALGLPGAWVVSISFSAATGELLWTVGVKKPPGELQEVIFDKAGNLIRIHATPKNYC